MLYFLDMTAFPVRITIHSSQNFKEDKTPH